MVSKARLHNNLVIFKSENPFLDIDELKFRFTYENPIFYRNQALGLNTFGVPRQICLAVEENDRIQLPRGLVSQLFLQKEPLEIVDDTITQEVRFNESKIILKHYQHQVVQKMLQQNQGIIVSPPGTGKTILAIESLIRRQQKSLILVHTKDLATQWSQRFQEFTNLTPGMINADGFNIEDVTIAMVQSLNRPLEKTFLNAFGLILLDESHHAPAFTFRTLVSQFPARYRYGLTATPVRNDGLTFLLHAVLGNTLCRVEDDHLFENGEIFKPKVIVIHTNSYLPDCNDYTRLIYGLTRDTGRNQLIISHVKKEAEHGHFCLILTGRISHANKLLRLLQEQSAIPALSLTSKNTKDERSKGIEQMNKGEARVLFATKLADEGLDIRRLDRLFLTCPIRATNKLTQQIGRIQRVFPGKQDAVVYDFVDSLNSLALSQYNTRKETVYQRYDVTEITFEAQP